MEKILCNSILAKVDEQIELSNHFISLVPEDKLDWKPSFTDAFSVVFLLGHILECFAGFCAVLIGAKPDELQHFEDSCKHPVNHRCGTAEAHEQINIYHLRIKEGFALLKDEDLAKRVPTVFVPEGETLMTLLLGNFEHLMNHKHQLFMYLKLLGLDVDSKDLYQFRGE